MLASMAMLSDAGLGVVAGALPLEGGTVEYARRQGHQTQLMLPLPLLLQRRPVGEVRRHSFRAHVRCFDHAERLVNS